MSKELVISTSPHETRVAILENGNLVEIYVEREKEYALVGSIYKGRVTRVLPGMQSAFVDIGLDTDAFLYVSDVLEEIEEYDQIVSTVEEKVAKMEEQGGQVFAPSSSAEAEEPPEVTGNVEPVAPPVAPPAPPRPSGGGFRNDQARGPERGGFNRGGDRGGFRRGGEQGGFNRGPQRGGRNRGNRSGRGMRDDRRQLPSSKYVNHGGGGYDRQDAPRGPHQDAPRELSEPTNYEPILLPGESLAKYKDRKPGPVANSAEPAAAPASSVSTHATLPHETVAEQASDAATRDRAGAAAEESLTEHRAEVFTQSLPAEGPTAEKSPIHGERQVSEVGISRQAPQPVQEASVEEAPIEEAATEEAEDQAAFGLTSSTPATAEPQAGTAPPSTPATHEESGKEVLSEAEAAAVLEAAEEEAQEAVIEGDEEMRMAETYPETDTEEETDREIREGILEAASAAEPPGAAGGEGVEERTARVHEDPRQRFTRPMRQPPQPRRGPPARGRPHERHQAQRRSQSISDLLKPAQEIIIQIAKEPLGKKGARITSHVALPGRFLVYMPTLEHTGVSRKISSSDARARLRHLVTQYNTKFPGGFIVRTAAEAASEDEVRADIEYLGHTWQEIRSRAEQRRAPALLHRDLNLVERVLRDYFSPDFTAIWVDNQEEFTRVVEFIGRFQPGLVSRVKLYTKEAPIFEEFGIQQEIDKALRPKVWLKSGGYIVINHTEALVAIDVNTGKFVGKGSTRLEDTIVKANLEACKEIIRQIRLRDLGGIIIVDFIDMEERKNRAKVMQALEEELRDDRAPSKVLGFNEFGLVAITRKRTKQALERVLCQPCPYCTGSGMVKSIHTICYEAQAEARKMAPELDSQSLTLRVHPEIAKALKTRESALIEELERWTKKSVIIHGDPSLHWEQYDIY
jgi:ribonuclease G